MEYKILLSNIGYARGINGLLSSHLRYAHRYLYTSRRVQHEVLKQLKQLIDQEKPDLGCLIEIDQGSFHLGHVNQLQQLIDEHYCYFDIENKYGDKKGLRLPGSAGKSNAFFASHPVVFKKIYFEHGTKRLIYHLVLPGGITLFFTHFSLKKRVRVKQFEELRKLVIECDGPVIILGDFNIFGGFAELTPLLRDTGLVIVSQEHLHTFTLHKRRMALDLCLSSESLSKAIELKVVDQPYSDHAAIVVTLEMGEFL